MNNCIYYRDRPDLTFDQAEHIIPAGIGGQYTLPKGYVSDQFNHDISKIEMAFMRQSIVAMPRQLVGPGKRGKNSHKPTRSPVMVISQSGSTETHALGYLSLAKAIHLPQIRINTITGELNWSVPVEMEAKPDAYLLGEMQRCSGLNTCYLTEKRLSEDEVIIGFDERLYIAHHPGRRFELTPEIIAGIRDSITKSSGPYRQLNHSVSFNQVAIIADDFYRVAAKIALNTLALLKGKEFVLDIAFDSLRQYVSEGGQNPGVVIIPKPGRMPQFPPDAHHLMFAVSGRKLAANVCFYNQFTVNVILAEKFIATFQPKVYLCDWRNKYEGLL